VAAADTGVAVEVIGDRTGPESILTIRRSVTYGRQLRPQKASLMFTNQYRAKASEYPTLVGIANGPNELRELQRLERSFAELADNAQWVIENHDKTVHATEHQA
jgi:hypothetical protein